MTALWDVADAWGDIVDPATGCSPNMLYHQLTECLADVCNKAASAFRLEATALQSARTDVERAYPAHDLALAEGEAERLSVVAVAR